MHRFYLPPEQCRGQVLRLRDREAHHASRVLRLQRGDRLTVLDGVGNQYLCELQSCGREEADLAVLQTDRAVPPPYRVTLLQAIPKGKLLEDIIQKATELGVHRIVPILSERTVVHLEPEDCQDKLEKWRQVAIEAIKQCGCPWLPQIEAPARPAACLAQHIQFDLALIGSLQAGSRHPRSYFENYRRTHHRTPGSVGVWIGPEGDFTPEEITAIQASGAEPITLGPQVLRSETAALYSLSVINYELQSLGNASE